VDQRDDHDSHEVVPLRRKDDPDAAERAELANQIFAQEDEIGTFSRGNLIPPPTTSDKPASTDGSDALLQRLGLRNEDEFGLPETSKAQQAEPDTVPDAIAADGPTGVAADARTPKAASDLSTSTSPPAATHEIPGGTRLRGALIAGRACLPTWPIRPRTRASGTVARRGQTSRPWRPRGRSRLLALAMIAAIAAAIPLTLLTLDRGKKQTGDRHAPAIQANTGRFGPAPTVDTTISKHPPLRPTNPASPVQHRPRHSHRTRGPIRGHTAPTQSSTATCCTTGIDVAQVDTQPPDNYSASDQPARSTTGSSGTPAPESSTQPTTPAPSSSQTSSQTTTSQSSGPKSPYSTFGPGS
jgi:hypothetical protein